LQLALGTSQTMLLSTLCTSKMNHRFLENQLVAEVGIKVSFQMVGGVGNAMQNWRREIV